MNTKKKILSTLLSLTTLTSAVGDFNDAIAAADNILFINERTIRFDDLCGSITCVQNIPRFESEPDVEEMNLGNPYRASYISYGSKLTHLIIFSLDEVRAKSIALNFQNIFQEQINSNRSETTEMKLYFEDDPLDEDGIASLVNSTEKGSVLYTVVDKVI